MIYCKTCREEEKLPKIANMIGARCNICKTVIECYDNPKLKKEDYVRKEIKEEVRGEE